MKSKVLISSIICSGLLFSSCNNFLDREPLDSVTPGDYLNNVNDLAAYSINQYSFSSHGNFGLGTLLGDVHTDNMVDTDGSPYYWEKGNRKVPSDGGWDFSAIRKCNYFFDDVLPKWKEGKITGDETEINHYIGEMYFLRAWAYFGKLKTYGDFPIVKTTLIDNEDQLIKASERSPRNKVARFILNDLDSAAMLMKPLFKNKNRLSQKVALMVKSRVALHEASWLTYHKGTAFVPGGAGWPGASAPYNQEFSIDIDSEIKFFLNEAMISSKEVADGITLTPNSGVTNPIGKKHEGWNPYFEMFGLVDMGVNDEILFWKAYSGELSITHGVSVYIRAGGNNGLTKNYVDGFLMKNGLPIYATGSGYKGDVTLMDQKQNRDDRLNLFVFGENDSLTVEKSYGYPTIIDLKETRDVSGFRIRKCYNYDPAQAPGSTLDCTYGSIVFRGVEAHLNYIEASYMLNSSLDATATAYWNALRSRAGIDGSIAKTIQATDLSLEKDWAKYSGVQLVDRTLFNIRRERRNEFIGESMRWDDLKRWRALDKVDNYIVEGFNLWDKAFEATAYKDSVFKDDKFTGVIKDALIPAGSAEGTPNVSSKSRSKYLRPYQIIEKNNSLFNGYNWSKAAYLSPISYFQMALTAKDKNDVSTSVLYQNPYWPSTAGGVALE